MKPRKRVIKRKGRREKFHGLTRLHSKRGPRYLPEELAGMYKPVKKPVTLRLDADILAWFQRGGRGYQTRINSGSSEGDGRGEKENARIVSESLFGQVRDNSQNGTIGKSGTWQSTGNVVSSSANRFGFLITLVILANGP